MFNNVLMTSLTTLGETSELTGWSNQPFMTSWPEPSFKPKDTLVTKIVKKKNKRNRTAYTTDQLRTLEDTYTRTKYVDAERRKELAKQLNVGEKCIKVWFQNRRMKEKKESSESCDSSSESFEVVTPPPVGEYKNLQPDTTTTNTEAPFEGQYQYSYMQNQLNEAYQPPQNFYNYYNHNSFPYNYFQSDTNVYPTYYYPVNSDCYSNAHQNYNNDYNNVAWDGNNFNCDDFESNILL